MTGETDSGQSSTDGENRVLTATVHHAIEAAEFPAVLTATDEVDPSAGLQKQAKLRKHQRHGAEQLPSRDRQQGQS